MPVCSPNACKGVINPNVTIFQSNCAEGLHLVFFSFVLQFIIYFIVCFALSVTLIMVSSSDGPSSCHVTHLLELLFNALVLLVGLQELDYITNVDKLKKDIKVFKFIALALYVLDGSTYIHVLCILGIYAFYRIFCSISF